MDEQVTIEMETPPVVPVKTSDDPSFNPNSDPHEHQYGININKQIVCMLCGREKPPLEPITPVSPTSQVAAQTEVITETASQPTDQQPEPINEEQTPTKEQEETMIEVKNIETGEVVGYENKRPNNSGAPCKFCTNREQILKTTRDYITSGTGEKPKVLFVIELALKLGIHRDTLYDWVHKKEAEHGRLHSEFSDMVKEVEQMQELSLQKRILGRYSPVGAIFLLKTKHGYIETEKQILAGDNKEPLQITIVEDKKFGQE